MQQENFFIGPAYLSIENVFDSSDKCGKQINRPDFWKDEGEVIVWGYRISGSEVSFHSQVDYLYPTKLGYLSLCQYVCDCMAVLLGDCLEKMKRRNNIENGYVIPAELSFRIYHYCAYLSYEEEEQLSRKLRDIFRSGKFTQANSKGRLSEKLSQIEEIEFCVGNNSKTLESRIGSEKQHLIREIGRQRLNTYQDYSNFKQQQINNYNQLDKLDL